MDTLLGVTLHLDPVKKFVNFLLRQMATPQMLVILQLAQVMVHQHNTKFYTNPSKPLPKGFFVTKTPEKINSLTI